jgi:hypothetical protein
MKKILIVDDEYIVRLGLKIIVDWAAFGYAVAGEAANGREAFDFFEKNLVDVILMDIKMPVMDETGGMPGLHAGAECPADNPAVKQVHHRGQVYPACGRAHIGDAGHPLLSVAAGGKLAVQPVFADRKTVARVGCPRAGTPQAGVEIIFPH